MSSATLTNTSRIQFDNLAIEVSVMNTTVKGILNGSNRYWNFTSTDPTFLATYPSGIMYSFSIYVDNDTSTDYGRYHTALVRKIGELGVALTN